MGHILATRDKGFGGGYRLWQGGIPILSPTDGCWVACNSQCKVVAILDPEAFTSSTNFSLKPGDGPVEVKIRVKRVEG